MNPPVFGHGELRLLLLALIAEQPRHGYELIQALTDRFGGSYSPSAGTIYPRLARLEADGLVTKTEDGRKSVYEITAAGRKEVSERQAEIEHITSRPVSSVQGFANQARAGLADARADLRAEIDRLAAQLRTEGAEPASNEGGRDQAQYPAADIGVTDSSDESYEHVAPDASTPEGAAQRVRENASGPLSDHRLLVEAELQRFRSQLQFDIREASRAGRLNAATADEVGDVLQETQRRLAAALGVQD